MESIWSKTWSRKKSPALNGEIQADVAVIGGGMAGILTAWYLKQSGVQVVVLEADRIGGGQTKNTTAKITAQHGLFCSRLIETKGEEVARNYVQANQTAVEAYKRMIREEDIDCDFRESDAYVYSQDEDKIRKEVEAAKILGIHASIENHLEIPVSYAGAVRFPRQAEFHPLKFIGALARQLTIYEDTMVTEIQDHLVKTTCGSVKADKIVIATHFPFINFPDMYFTQLTIYEDTMVTEIQDHLVKTTCGSVKADKIVIATHFPFINFPDMYFTRMHQERSYVLALSGAGKLNGMYIGNEQGMFSFRQYDQYILLGGRAHRTGENRTGGQYEALKESAKKMFPESKVSAYWSNQDCVTIDHLPFIGRYAAKHPNWFVATGFQKWGMSLSMVSARLLNDLICGIKNEYAEIFSPSRFSMKEIPGIMKEGGKAVKGLTKRFFQVPDETIASIEPGHGAVADTPQGKVGVYKTETGQIYQVVKGLTKRFFQVPDETIASIEPGHGAVADTPQGKVGVYKTETGQIYQVDPICPHLGCELSWNPEENSWDCPCHGSRFDYKGNLLNGPAQRGIR